MVATAPVLFVLNVARMPTYLSKSQIQMEFAGQVARLKITPTIPNA
jgi:hypothetical protein